MTMLLQFGFVVLLAIACAVLLCRWRISHNKRVSIGTLIVSACIAAVISDALIAAFRGGLWDFTAGYWSWEKIGGGFPWLFYFVAWIVTLFPSTLAAFGVVIFYGRRNH